MRSVDDSFLQRAASSIPKRAIFLIEDIDCAFPSREEGEHPMPLLHGYPGMMGLGPRLSSRTRSAVTLSGLLNVIDGVGSEEGKLFFATVYVPSPRFRTRFLLAFVRLIISTTWTLHFFVLDALTAKYSTSWRQGNKLPRCFFVFSRNPTLLSRTRKLRL